jgi:hypothetical protein
MLVMRNLVIALLIAAIASVTVSTSSLAARPDPTFNVSCTVGGDTVVSWKGVQIDSIHIEWFNSSGTQLATGNVASPHGTKYSASTPSTMDAGGTVEVIVVFTRPINGADSARLQPATCT